MGAEALQRALIRSGRALSRPHVPPESLRRTAEVNRRVTIASAAGIVVCAVVAVLVWRALPASRPDEVVLVTVDRSSSPGDNERSLAAPIENALTHVKGLKHLRSESRAGCTIVTCTFEHGADGLTAAQAVREALGPALMELPQDASPPLVTRDAARTPPLWIVGEPSLKERLERLSGVGAVELCGDTEARLRVQIDPVRLAATGTELAALLQAVETVTRGARTLDTWQKEPLPAPDAVAQAIVGSTTPPVRVADVASVVAERVSTGCEVRGLGEHQVLAQVTLQAGASRPDVTKRIEAAIRETTGGARWLAPGSTLAIAVGIAEIASRKPLAGQLAAMLARMKGITSVLVTTHARRDDVIEFLVELDGNATKAIVGEIQQGIAKTQPGVRWRGVRSSPFGMPAVLAVSVRDPALGTPGALDARAEELDAKLASVPGIGTRLREPTAPPTLEITIDRARARDVGVALGDVQQAIRAAAGGIAIGRVLVHVGDPDAPGSADALFGSGLLVHRMPLSLLANVTSKSEPATILHLDRQRAIELHWETQPELSKTTLETALAGTGAQIELESR